MDALFVCKVLEHQLKSAAARQAGPNGNADAEDGHKSACDIARVALCFGQ